MAGACPSDAAEEDQRIVDRQARQCDEDIGRGRTMGADKTVQHWLVGGENVQRQARRNTGCSSCPAWREVRSQIPEGLAKRGQRAKTSNEVWNWQRGITSHPLSEVKRRKSHLSVHE